MRYQFPNARALIAWLYEMSKDPALREPSQCAFWQAADTIERLTKERDAARAEVEQQRKHIGGLEYHIDAARCEVGRLKAELHAFSEDE